jgi:membrane protease YdiL (CAAX protease family)
MKDSTATKFFLLTFLLSWGAWGLLVWLVPSGLDPASPSYLLFMLGGFGPTLVGIIVTAMHEGKRGLSDLWRRTWRLGFGLQWYLVIFILFPAINALTILVTWFASGSPADFSLAESLVASPNLVIPFLLSIFITGPLAEEYGWRGYALDRLQGRFGPAIASLLLGILWALWHLPLFFMNGAPQHDSGQSLPLFLLWILALSPIYTWVYNGTRRNLMAILLLHWIGNTAGALLPTAKGETIGVMLVSVLILLSWRSITEMSTSVKDNKQKIGESYE